MLSVDYYDEDKSHYFESDNSSTDIHVNYLIRGAYVFSESANSHKKELYFLSRRPMSYCCMHKRSLPHVNN